MKKTITYSFLFAVCFGCLTSCSKDVKSPVKVANNTASTNTSAGSQTSTPNQSGHTCGGDHSSNSGGGD